MTQNKSVLNASEVLARPPSVVCFKTITQLDVLELIYRCIRADGKALEVSWQCMRHLIFAQLSQCTHQP